MPLEATAPAQATTADLTARAGTRSAALAQFTERGRRRQDHPRCGPGRMGCPRVSQAALDIVSPALADDGLADGRPASLASMEAVPAGPGAPESATCGQRSPTQRCPRTRSVVGSCDCHQTPAHGRRDSDRGCCWKQASNVRG